MVVSIGALIVLTLGFLGGRSSVRLYTGYRDPDDPAVTDEFVRFQQLGRSMLGYIVTRDGRVPEDLYGACVEGRAVVSFGDFIFGQAVLMHDVRELPCRINPDLSRNAKAPFCWIIRPDIAEVWACYLDGSCERESRRGLLDRGRMSSFGERQMSWRRLLHAGAGYPYWPSIEEKARWCESQGNQIEWDAQRGLFVPTVNVADRSGTATRATPVISE